MKMFIEHKDYLPEGWTFDRIIEAIEAKQAKPFTREALAEIVSEEALNLTEDDLIEYLVKHYQEEEEPVPPFLTSLMPQQRFAYAENLDKDDELNQEFPDPKEEK